MSAAVGWVILIPLGSAVLTSLLRGRAAHVVAVATGVATACVAGLVVAEVAIQGTIEHTFGGWAPPLGIQLRADGLAAVLLATIAIVGAIVSAHAVSDETARSGATGFFSLWFCAWAALNALVLSNDIFNLYVTLELATLATVGLIAIRGDRAALQAALRYLLVALPGSLLYLLGVAMLYGMHSTLDLTQLGARVTSTLPTWVALSLMVVGLGLKAAVFPVHAWLPPAYMTARPVVSALLSALISKAAFFVLLKLWSGMAPLGFERVTGQLLGLLASLGILWGSLLALRQSRLRRVIAYSSIAQIGYLIMALALGTPGAVSGGVYVAISHAAAAASLFIAAGVIERTLGHGELSDLNRLFQRFPITFFSVALSGVSLMGMPPTGGFVGKWLLVRAAIEGGRWWWAIVMVVGGLIAAGYVFRILQGAFRAAPQDERPPPRGVRGGELVAFALAAVSVVLGMMPGPVLALLEIGRP